MDTETQLLATPEQVDGLIAELQAAKKKAEKTGEAAYARSVLEQMTHRGPWRLTIGVFPPDGPSARG